MIVKLKENFFPAVLILLLFITPMEAATIKLKLQSGRVMEGEVTERADDYIKIKDAKGEYKVQLKLIDQEGTKALNNVTEKKKEIVTDKTLEDWEAWKEKNGDYYGKADHLRAQFFMSVEKVTQGINKAIERNDIPSAGGAAEDSKREILSLIGQLDELRPPEELNGFQQNLREAFINTKKSLDAWALSDQQGYHQFRKKSTHALLAAFQELRDAHQMMGATPGYIDVLDQQIQQYKDEVGKIYR